MNDRALDLPVIEPRGFVHLDVRVDDRMICTSHKNIIGKGGPTLKTDLNTLPLPPPDTKCRCFLGGCLSSQD
jgi:hypothetical protein